MEEAALFTDKVVAALVGLAGTIIALVYTKPMNALKFWQGRRKRKDLIAALEDAREGYELLEEIRRSTSADRVLLLAGHNGGGIPSLGSPFYTSVIFASIDEEHEVYRNTIDSYRNLPVDAAYISMLLDSEKEGRIVLNVERMPKCQLKSYYKMEGVTHSVLFFLAVKNNKFIYATVAKTTPGVFSEDEITKMELHMQEIRGYIG